ncbi:MAG TPA: hopanoid biosynthesis-associated protein HpnK [Candidatus Dormibacteraeota bacterium]|nr:hopanoid biosynthesis-associated protein HpnK [Candidatus Dormibacteraeota bacterium]
MKELILNADDFGLTRGVNEGIIRAHRDGILTNATLMASSRAFDDAVARAKATPTLGVGCHLVIVGGTAVSPPPAIPSLVDADGKFPRTLPQLVARLSSGSVRSRDIETELRAQIEKIRHAGIEPTHVDTHKHTHVHPLVMNALGKVANELGITRVRKPAEDLADSWETQAAGERSWSSLASAAAVRAAALWFESLARKYGLRSPDHFLGLAMTGRLGAAALCQLIDNLPEGRTEIMLHPGMCDADLASTGSRLQQQRQLELEALLAPEVRRAVERNAVRLITYRELN